MKITTSLMVISLFLFSCSTSSTENGNETHDGHQHDSEMQTIELNNGEKWTVDANMLTHIRNMENDINSFANNETKNYKSLAEKLQANINLLTANCTMTGQAHDELHKWLVPYIDLVAELSEAKNDIDAAKQFEKIQTSYTTFNTYFQ